jgi:hypothetical protein
MGACSDQEQLAEFDLGLDLCCVVVGVVAAMVDVTFIAAIVFFFVVVFVSPGDEAVAPLQGRLALSGGGRRAPGVAVDEVEGETAEQPRQLVAAAAAAPHRGLDHPLHQRSRGRRGGPCRQHLQQQQSAQHPIGLAGSLLRAAHRQQQKHVRHGLATCRPTICRVVVRVVSCRVCGGAGRENVRRCGAVGWVGGTGGEEVFAEELAGHLSEDGRCPEAHSHALERGTHRALSLAALVHQL